MYDMPEHVLVGVNAAGEGPVDATNPALDHWECLCTPGVKVSVKFNGGAGLTLCETSGEMLANGFPPRWREGVGR